MIQHSTSEREFLKSNESRSCSIVSFLLSFIQTYISCLLTLRYFLELDQKCQFELLKSKHIALRSLLTLKKEKNDFGDNYIEFFGVFFFLQYKKTLSFPLISAIMLFALLHDYLEYLRYSHLHNFCYVPVRVIYTTKWNWVKPVPEPEYKVQKLLFVLSEIIGLGYFSLYWRFITCWLEVSYWFACLFFHSFDAELNKSQEEVRDERNLREKLQRERDQLASSKITLEQDLQVRPTLQVYF